MINVVVLQGALSSAPVRKELPSGDELVTYEVTVRAEDQPTESVNVVWLAPPPRAAELATGEVVVVTGRVRRRFFRTPAGTASRTEVVADVVVPARQRKRAQTATAAAVARLAARDE